MRFSVLSKKVRQLCRDQSGNAAVMFSLALVPLVGGVGVAIDYNRASTTKAYMQTAADAAVLTAARAMSAGTTAAKAQGEAQFDANFPADGSVASITRVVNISADTITATASATMNTSFMAAFGKMGMNIAVVSEAQPGKGAPCLIVRSQTNPAFTVNGTAITAPACEIHVQSPTVNSALFNNTKVDVARQCITASGMLANSSTTPNVQLQCPPIGNPLEGKVKIPDTNCTNTAMNYNAVSVTLSPGVYCGNMLFNAVPLLTLQPGLYVIRSAANQTLPAAWMLNNTKLRGEGVTFYFADSSRLLFNAVVDMELTPPATGDYAGILMAEAEGLAPSPFLFNNFSNFNMTGILYLPSRNVSLNAAMSTIGNKLMMIVNTATVNATTWSMAPLGNAPGARVASLLR